MAELELKNVKEEESEPAQPSANGALSTQDETAVSANSNSGESKKQKSRKGKRRQLNADHVVQSFAACGRCSCFLASCKLLVGAEAVEAAILAAEKGWMALNASRSLRQLVNKSFGNYIDNDCYHLEGCCRMCRRRFIFSEANGSGTATLKIEMRLKPHR